MIVMQARREVYEQPTYQLGQRVSWRDPELRIRCTGYVNGYWGSTDGHPVPLLYGVVPDANDCGDQAVVWLHHHQVRPLS